MSDISAEVAALKAQLAALTTAAQSAGVKLEAKSIFVVYNPRKQARWCSKIDCPALGRKTSYDVVREVDEEAEALIQTGVSEEVLEALKKQYGFDRPIYERYFIWLKNLL